ncbi:MAG: diaminopimelate epimerase [Muribaculaceae bacterium]|nr:diaminopimelate epimerase [Muribaculaceae bacterium]
MTIKETNHRPTRQRVHFIKMHGVGNDYIFVDTTRDAIPDPRAAAKAWSRRHTGVCSDGLVLIGRPASTEADFTMRIFNADGSEGLMCGNASRCIGKYVYERGLTDKTEIGLLTASGVKTLMLTLGAGRNVTAVTVDMGVPELANPRQFMPVAEIFPAGTFVSMGNPHYVIFVNDIETVDLSSEGPLLEHHPCFPERCNIEFVQVKADGLRMRVWERGSGITMACGTGACATAVAAAVTQRAGRRTQVMMDGGTLTVEWRESDGHVLLTGPATIVFEGDIELP